MKNLKSAALLTLVDLLLVAVSMLAAITAGVLSDRSGWSMFGTHPDGTAATTALLALAVGMNVYLPLRTALEKVRERLAERQARGLDGQTPTRIPAAEDDSHATRTAA